MPRHGTYSITVQTMQILNDQLYKAGDGNKTLDERKKYAQTHTSGSDYQCYQYYMALKIYIPGHAHTPNE